MYRACRLWLSQRVPVLFLERESKCGIGVLGVIHDIVLK